AMALLVAGCASFGTHPDSKGKAPQPTTVSRPSATPSASRNLLPVGSGDLKLGTAGTYGVGSSVFTITEPAHANAAGTAIPARQLLMEIRYPLAGRPSKTNRPARGPLPLIMFAPGFMQCGLHYFDMLKYWATAGYVIAVVNFPKSDCKVGDAA